MQSLVKILENLWTENIKSMYMSGLISTERTLQAEIYRQLKNHDKYDIWIEPTLSFDPATVLDYKKPDILITIEREISGTYKLPLLTIPNRGEWDRGHKNLFDISTNILTVFAVIARNDAWSLYSDKWEKQNVRLPRNFLHLTGSISEEEIIFKTIHLR